MPSEKLTRILRARCGLSEAEIAAISDADGWKLVYANKPASAGKRYEICFTGFSDVEKNELNQIAVERGMFVVTTVTKHLDCLCVGPSPGPSKLEKAQRQNVQCLSAEEFKLLVETGEVPAW
jgi:NAD-dependent DNA ligase